MAQDLGLATLGTGAGMGDAIARILAQRLLEAKLQEEQRSNQATESLHNRALDQNDQLRRDTLAEKTATSRAAQATKDSALRDKQAGEQGIGDVVTNPDFRAQTSTAPGGGGKPISLYGIAKVNDKGELPPGVIVPNGEGPLPLDQQSRIYQGTGKDRLDWEKVAVDREKLDKEKNTGVHSFALNGANITAQQTANGRVIYRGEDVTDRVTPYVPPPNPTIIQSGTGFAAVTDQRSPTPIATPVLEKGTGKQAGLAVTGTTRSRMETAKQIGSHFGEIAKQVEEADQRGLLGPISGRWSDYLAGKVGSTGNPDDDRFLGQLRLEISAVKSGFAMVHGGVRGGGSIQMAERWDKILDSGKMSKDELLGALSGMKGWIDRYGQDPNSAPPEASSGSPSRVGSAGTPPPASPGRRYVPKLDASGVQIGWTSVPDTQPRGTAPPPRNPNPAAGAPAPAPAVAPRGPVTPMSNAQPTPPTGPTPTSLSSISPAPAAAAAPPPPTSAGTVMIYWPQKRQFVPFESQAQADQQITILKRQGLWDYLDAPRGGIDEMAR